MTPGCTNPAAANYNPAADTEDYSCIYLKRYDGTCYAFQDVPPSEIEDKSFTLSFSLEEMDWVMFHDYIPDFYFSTRNRLFNLKGNKIYKHNAGAPGVYHSSTPKSFFIDMVFADKQEMLLRSVEWITEVIGNNVETEMSTLTHITIWNAQQCTGRIALSSVFDQLQYSTHRKTQGKWSFNHIRDMVKTRGTTFLLDIFNNFAVISNSISQTKPWYEKALLSDNYFVIRFEFDNTSGKQIFFHGADINDKLTPR
ncbi:MAG: hypothetical protein HYU71_06360 [Bacteroidetes bacterium]|nr:hypothetical protein [Bacteroidota bacterium]